MNNTPNLIKLVEKKLITSNLTEADKNLLLDAANGNTITICNKTIDSCDFHAVLSLIYEHIDNIDDIVKCRGTDTICCECALKIATVYYDYDNNITLQNYNKRKTLLLGFYEQRPAKIMFLLAVHTFLYNKVIENSQNLILEYHRSAAEKDPKYYKDLADYVLDLHLRGEYNETPENMVFYYSKSYDNGDEDAYFNLAKYFLHIKDYSNAEQYLELSVNTSVHGLMLYATFLDDFKKDYAKAIKIYAKISIDSIEFLKNRLMCAFRSGDYGPNNKYINEYINYYSDKNKALNAAANIAYSVCSYHIATSLYISFAAETNYFNSKMFESAYYTGDINLMHEVLEIGSLCAFYYNCDNYLLSITEIFDLFENIGIYFKKWIFAELGIIDYLQEISNKIIFIADIRIIQEILCQMNFDNKNSRPDPSYFKNYFVKILLFGFIDGIVKSYYSMLLQANIAISDDIFTIEFNKIKDNGYGKKDHIINSDIDDLKQILSNCIEYFLNKYYQVGFPGYNKALVHFNNFR